MTTKRLLVTGDPAASFDESRDETLRLVAGALRRGWRVDYCDLTTTQTSIPSWVYLAGLPVQAVRRVTGKPGAPMALAPTRVAGIGTYSAVVHRKPRTKEALVLYRRHFNEAPQSVVQVASDEIVPAAPDENGEEAMIERIERLIETSHCR